MHSEEISFWLPKLKYDAMYSVLAAQGKSIESELQVVAEHLYEQLVPVDQQQEIETLIRQERLAAEQFKAAHRRFSVFRIVEDRQVSYLECEHPFDFLNAAYQTRRYARNEVGAKLTSFADYLLQSGSSISEKRYAELIDEYINGSSNITGIFDIDFDKGDFLVAQQDSGWEGFILKDVTTAVYHAYRKESRSFNDKWNVFLNHLDGRQMIKDTFAEKETKEGIRLSQDDICFSGEIMVENGKLNFYMDTILNVDRVFGTHVETTENDDWLNIYVNYDMEQRQVCDTLDIILHRNDGSDKELSYTLNAAEKEILLRKMDAYCLECEGVMLDAYCDQRMAEEQSPPMEPRM